MEEQVDNSGKLLMGGVQMHPKLRSPRGFGALMNKVSNDLEPKLNDIRFFKNAPFTNIGLILFYGDFNDEPKVKKIIDAYKELPVEMQIDIKKFQGATDDEQYDLLLHRCIACINVVAEKYKLPFFSQVEG